MCGQIRRAGQEIYLGLDEPRAPSGSQGEMSSLRLDPGSADVNVNVSDGQKLFQAGV